MQAKIIRVTVLLITCCLVFYPSASKACSIMPGPVTTSLSYEQMLPDSDTHAQRAVIDMADRIYLGKFLKPKADRTPQFVIKQSLKHSEARIKTRRISVAWDNFDTEIVTYVSGQYEHNASPASHASDWGKGRPAGIDGQYGPGDCRIWLEIDLEQDYIIFADNDFSIRAMQKVGMKDEYVRSIKKLVKDPALLYGAEFGLQDLIERNVQVLLLETHSCLPTPRLNILASVNYKKQERFVTARPIDVYPEGFGKTQWELTDKEKYAARREGLKTGYYENFPRQNVCRVGQRFLSVGEFFWRTAEPATGQIFMEKPAGFDLSKQTFYDHEMSPSMYSVDDIQNLLSSDAVSLSEQE